MTKIKPLSETDNTVTLRRSDFRTLLDAAEEGADLAAVRRHRSQEDAVGWSAAKRNYLTRKEAERLLSGESPVRVWREKRGMTQRALAEAGEINPSYLAEIETGKKPGSPGALSCIAGILEVPIENLTADSTSAPSPRLQPVTRAEKAAGRLVRLAERTGTRDRLVEEAHAIVREWLEIAGREGVRHQVKAAIGSLRSLVTQSSVERARLAVEQDRNGDAEAAQRMNRISQALEAAVDALTTEYRRL